MKQAIYAGTFDPITNGHLDVMQRARKLFDKVIVAVSDTSKKTLFSTDERVKLIEEATTNNPDIEIESFDTLLADYAKKKKTNILLRGLRAISDFEHEFQLSSINRKLNNDLETVFIMTDEKFSFLSSSAVKELASLNGDLSSLVPNCVETALKEKFS